MKERKVFVMRHGERCDFLMGGKHNGFMKNAFDSNGKYTPYDINLPRSVPKRADGWQSFASDSPLTEIGYLEAKLTGRAYKDKGVTVDHIYCSPALRCVQTAVGFIKGTGSNLTFQIEPGLFEWMFWSPNGRPSWMQPAEFAKLGSDNHEKTGDVCTLGYPIRNENSYVMKENELVPGESLDEFYRRTDVVVREILQRHPTGNILLVVHGPSIEVCTRMLTGGRPRSVEEFFHILLQSSYLSNVEMKEVRSGRFVLNGRPVPPLTVSAVTTFNPNILEMSDEEIREEMRRKELERRKHV